MKKIKIKSQSSINGKITIRKAILQTQSNKHSFREFFVSALVGIIFSSLFSFGVYVFATVPLGQLDPGCAASDPNCTVVAPVPYTGATTSVDLGTQNLTTGSSTKFKYNSSNYATLNVGSNGDVTVAATSGSGSGSITLSSPAASNATLLSESGILVLGGGISGDESLNFDFHDNADRVTVTSTTGATALDLGSLNLITSGTITLGSSTSGTLVTRVKAGVPNELDTNGALVVDSTSGRLYFRYGSAWHYVAQTAGFQIPDFETTDPISGDKIVEGDLVLGMINKTFEDGALHGIWVKWEAVKQELLEELGADGAAAPAGGSVSGSVSGTSSNTLLNRVSNVLSSLGMKVADGVTTIKNLVTDKFQAKTARLDTLEMVDSSTGDVYCTWIENGDWKKSKGECGSSEVAIEGSQLSQQTNQAIQDAAQEAVQQVAQQVQNQIQEEVKTQVEQQLEGQPETPAPAENNSEENLQESSSSTETVEVEKEKKAEKEEKGEKEEISSQAPKAEEEVVLVEENVVPSTPEPAPEAPATPTDNLIEQSTSALFERMGNFVNWVASFTNPIAIYSKLQDSQKVSTSNTFIAGFANSFWGIRFLNPSGLLHLMTAGMVDSIHGLTTLTIDSFKIGRDGLHQLSAGLSGSLQGIKFLNPSGLLHLMTAGMVDSIHGLTTLTIDSFKIGKDGLSQLTAGLTEPWHNLWSLIKNQ